MKRSIFFRILFVLLMCYAISINLANAETYPPPTGTLIVANIVQSDVFDPIRVNNNHKYYMSIVFENLVGCDHSGKINSAFGLAEKWEMSSDAKTWTFYLRKNIKFHNGDEVTSDDVKFSIERVMSPKSIMTYSAMFRETIDKVEAVDQYTVRVHCKKPAPELHRSLSAESYEGFVMPKKYIEEKGDVYFGLHPVGTGPYKVTEIVGGYQIKLESAFENHWLYGQAKFKYLVFKLVPEELTRIGMMRTGETDIARISAERVASVRAAGLKVVEDPAADIPFIFPTEQWVKENPVHDKRVRQALALSINGKEIFEHIFYGVGRMTGSPTTVKGALGYVDLPVYSYNPEKAKQLLKEAGYPNGFKIKIHSFPTEMFPSLPKALEAIASFFEEVGVQAEIIPYSDYQAVRPKFIADELEGGIFANDTGGRSSPLRPIYLWYHSGSRFSFAQAPELDKWIDAANDTLDEKKRAELISKIDKYINDNYCFLFAVERAIPYAISKKLEPWDMGSLVYDINLPYVLMHKAPF